jgi:chromate transport protein ChrA
MIFTAWKIFQKGGETGWFGWFLGAASFLAMWFKLPERAVVIAAGIIGVVFLSQ